jgi:enediyne biosynthesis protein E4
VANDFGPPDFLCRNNRDGTFSNVIDQSLPHTPFSSMGSDIGDVDNDGHIDLFVADMAGTTYERTQRGLADSRARAFVTQNEQVGKTVQLLYNALYLGTGTSRCLDAAHLSGLAATDWTWSTRFEDLDQDGWLDLFVTTGMDREQNNLDMLERRLAAVSPWERINITKSSPVLNQANLAYVNRGGLRFEEVGKAWGLDHVGVSFGAAFGDLDGDGDLDLVFTNFEKGATVLRNDSQQGNSTVIALRGTASNRFGLGARVEATTKSGTQVRQLISARGYLSTSEPVVHFGCGDDATIERLRIVWPNGREQMLEKLATGRRYLITEEPDRLKAELRTAEQRSPGSPNPKATVLFEDVTAALGLAIVQREEPLEGTVAQPLLPRRFNRRGPGVAVGDLNRDGIDEIVLGATVIDGAKILRRDGSRYQVLDTGELGAKLPINDGPPLIFDANGDGTNDLLFTGGGAALPAEEPEYEPRLWLNDGRGAFRPAPDGALPSLPISTGAAVAADFDRDGALDLFLGARLLPGFYPESPTSALLLQRGGRLTDVTQAFAPELREIGLVTSALASDVDGDGWIDLIVALEWGGVRYLRNETGRALTDVSAAWGFDTAGSGLWTSLAAVDFNHDGRLDYAVGNLGLNTLYTASRERPLRLFAGNFAGSGEPQLIEAFEADGRLVPIASRAELSAKIPAVLKRFPSNNRYATATLEDVLGKEGLAKAVSYEAGELCSGVLLSDTTGRYTFSALPHYAQISPVQGMAAADFDCDGHSDLLLVHNDYSAIPARGRWDSGLGWLLRGDGHGGFQHVPIAESGWIVPGNAKALALVDLNSDARPDAIVSRNDQATLAFQNARSEVRSSAFRRSGDVAAAEAETPNSSEHLHFAMRLRGRAGNPDAIGARIVVESDGRILHLFEICAGGGYASQSTATTFFAIPRELAAEGKIRVRWPSGGTKELTLPAESGYVDVPE